MATNRPLTSRRCVSPDFTLRTCRASVCAAPSMPTTSESHTKVIFGCSRARRCMISEARMESRRWMMVTEEAKVVRNSASSRAESPPPTTAIGFSLKKNPSQVAHQLTP